MEALLHVLFYATPHESEEPPSEGRPKRVCRQLTWKEVETETNGPAPKPALSFPVSWTEQLGLLLELCMDVPAMAPAQSIANDVLDLVLSGNCRPVTHHLLHQMRPVMHELFYEIQPQHKYRASTGFKVGVYQCVRDPEAVVHAFELFTFAQCHPSRRNLFQPPFQLEPNALLAHLLHHLAQLKRLLL